MHRIDHRERRIGPEAEAAIVDRAERRGGVDHHADSVTALQPGIAIQVDRVAERGVRHDQADPVAIVAQEPFFGGRAGAPVLRVDVADQRGQPGPERGLRGRGEGQRRHQREPPGCTGAGCLADRDDQAKRRIGDSQGRAMAAEQMLVGLGLEGADLRAVVAEHARLLDPLQCVEMLAEARRLGGDEREAMHGIDGLSTWVRTAHLWSRTS
ncbi:hypothetical protein MGWOODY_Smn1569 [hydrothermal vent metagenome]|uniref:Uncharacterized protein n=1 Tax=hydrothermal vent metagenome TaxID=652676 RepID=A0A160TKI0_9ZZZZ